MDSIGAVELRSAISQRWGVAAPPTLIFDHPTPIALAAWLAPLLAATALSEVSGGGPLAAGNLHLAVSPLASMSALVAVTGASCRFPGAESGGLEAFWQSAASGSDLQSVMPLSKWDMEPLYSPDSAAAAGGAGTLYTRFAATLGKATGIAAFDPEAFRLTRAEAALMDPHTRLLLEHTTEAMTGGID